MKKKSSVFRKIVFSCVVLCVLIGGGIYFYNQPEEEDEQEILTVACVGDSLTFRRAYGAEEIHNYPEFLSEMLGASYDVTNYGEAGACVWQDGNYPYENLRVYRRSVECEADIFVIMLGTNDVWDYNWIGAERFKQEYVRLLETYLQSEYEPEVYLCTLPKIYQQDGTPLETGVGERIERLSDVIREVATEYGCRIIEMNQDTASHPEWYEKDWLHFNNKGAKEIADIIGEMIQKN